MKNKKTGAFLLLLACTLVWGSSFVVTKNVTDDFPVIWLIAIRFAIAAIVLGIISIKKLKSIDKPLIWRGALLGVLFSVGMCFQTYGVMLSTPGKGAFLTAAYCITVPFVLWMLAKKRPTVKNLIAGAVCLVGIGFVSLSANFTIATGDYLALIGSVIFAFHIVCVSMFVEKYDTMLLMFIQFVAGALLMTVIAPFFNEPPVIDGLVTVAQLCYLGIFCTGLPLFGQAISQKTLSATTVTIVLGFEAVFGALFSALLYHERFSLRSIIGFALIFAAVMISELSFKKRAKIGNS